MSWKPGQSGNPNGRTRRLKATADIISPREWQDLVKAQYELARSGDQAAAKWVGDRIEAPRVRQELTGAEGKPIALEHAESAAAELPTDALRELEQIAERINTERGNGAAHGRGNGSAH